MFYFHEVLNFLQFLLLLLSGVTSLDPEKKYLTLFKSLCLAFRFLSCFGLFVCLLVFCLTNCL